MKQTEFVLKIYLLSDLPEEEKDDYMMEDYHIGIEAWDVGEVFMIDQHITAWYPQLERLGINEEMEGTMFYGGNMTIDDLKNVLNDWGFVISKSEKHAKIIKGEDVECKINPYTDEETPYYRDDVILGEPLQPPLQRKSIEQLEREMNIAAANDDFEKAIELRNEIKRRKNEE